MTKEEIFFERAKIVGYELNCDEGVDERTGEPVKVYCVTWHTENGTGKMYQEITKEQYEFLKWRD